MNSTPRDSRRTFLVNPRFQWLAIAAANAAALLVVLALYLVTQASIRHVENAIHQSESAAPSLLPALERERHSLSTIFLACAVAVCFAVTIGSLVLSHRIAGPMHKMHRHLLRMAEIGELEDLEFREGDYFHEIPEAFNAVITRLRREKRAPYSDG